jgi:hypothetical protein
MCTSIIEIARAEGMAKRGDEWFRSPRRWSPTTMRVMRRWATSSRSTSSTPTSIPAHEPGRAHPGDRQGTARRARPGDRLG